MSDDENSYDGSDNSDIEDTPISLKKKLKSTMKTSKGIKYEDIDDSEIDDEEEEEEEENNVTQIGGVQDFPDEDDEEDDEEEEDDATEEDSDIELDEDGEPIIETKTKPAKTAKKTQIILGTGDDDDDDDEFDENYLQKFDNDLIKNYVNEFHPECLNHNYDEIAKLSIVIRNQEGIIVDPLHRTIPYLTKYERARVLGQRAKQIETGAKPLVKVPENIVDSYIIAELELREKKIPFIIRRPIPGGGCEYWCLKDLEQIAF